jgi:hypothetical protein
VHPELDEDHSFGDERPLELHDLLVRAGPLLVGGEPFDSLHQHPPVPGAVQHRHAAPAGQDRPEAPQEVVALLVVRGCRELCDPDVPRVERTDQAFDGAALAGRVPPLEDDTQGRPDSVVLELPTQHQP